MISIDVKTLALAHISDNKCPATRTSAGFTKFNAY